MDFKYSHELHDREDDYPLAPEVINIETEITGVEQHKLCAHYFGKASPFSR